MSPSAGDWINRMYGKLRKKDSTVGRGEWDGFRDLPRGREGEFASE